MVLQWVWHDWTCNTHTKGDLNLKWPNWGSSDIPKLLFLCTQKKISCKIKQTECFSSLFKSLWKYLCPTLFSVLFYFFQNDWFCISKFITTIKYKEEYNWHPFFFFSLCLPPSLHSLWPNPPQCCELLRGWKNFYSSSCSLLCPAQLLAHRKHSANVLWIIAFTRDGPILG